MRYGICSMRRALRRAGLSAAAETLVSLVSFDARNHISRKAAARVAKFCIGLRAEYLVLTLGSHSHTTPYRAWSGSRDPFLNFGRPILNLKITFAVWNLSISHISGNTAICLHLHMNKTHVSCNFNYLLENAGLLNVTVSHVHCKCGNVSETQCQIRVVVTTDH